MKQFWIEKTFITWTGSAKNRIERLKRQVWWGSEAPHPTDVSVVFFWIWTCFWGFGFSTT
jgi:hypothetical protein